MKISKIRKDAERVCKSYMFLRTMGVSPRIASKKCKNEARFIRVNRIAPVKIWNMVNGVPQWEPGRTVDYLNGYIKESSIYVYAHPYYKQALSKENWDMMLKMVIWS